MSVEKSVIVICDECEGICNTDHGHSTVASARDEARRHGWRRRNGKDVCRNCVELTVTSV